MAEGFVQLPPNSTGDKLRTLQGLAGQPAGVEQEVVSLSDSAGAIVDPSTEATALAILAAFGAGATEATLTAVLAALAPLGTQATLAQVLAALGPLATQATSAAILAALGGTVLGGGAGYQVGAAGSVRTPVTLSGRVSVEVWTDALEGSETNPTLPYLHWVLPETTWTLGAPIELAYQPADLIVDGRLYDNPNWGDGPAGDWPYSSASAWQWAGTDLLPEPFACDYQTAGS